MEHEEQQQDRKDKRSEAYKNSKNKSLCKAKTNNVEISNVVANAIGRMYI